MQFTKQQIEFFVNKITPVYPNLKLLNKVEVVQWCLDDLSFLGIEEEVAKIEGKKTQKKITNLKKKLEDNWGKKLMKDILPDKDNKWKQWTTTFSERLCDEIYTIMNQEIRMPKKPKKDLKKPDREISDAIIEVKSGTYFTEGTALDKIFSVPILFIPDLPVWNKKLIILLVGKAEKFGREFGILGDIVEPSRSKYYQMFKDDNCHFVGFTDLLKVEIQKRESPIQKKMRRQSEKAKKLPTADEEIEFIETLYNRHVAIQEFREALNH